MSDWSAFEAAIDEVAAETFGRRVTYRPKGGVGADIVAIFDEVALDGRFSEDGDMAGRAVSTVEPQLVVRRSAFVAAFGPREPDEGDDVVVTIAGEPRRYVVSDAAPDGSASWRLALRVVRRTT